MEPASLFKNYFIEKRRGIRGLDDWISEGKVEQAKKKVLEITDDYLDLDDHSLTTLPQLLWQFKNLCVLSLANNNLKALPAEIGALVNLEMLDLSANKLKTLPGEIGKLASLRTFYLQKNQLNALPPEIGQLTSLRTLFLCFNNLKTVPVEIGKLANLATIELGWNKLEYLPPEMGLCRRMKALSIESNRHLNQIPLSLGQIPALIQLNAYTTGISQDWIDALLNQCRSLRKEEFSSRLHSWKVIAEFEGKIDGFSASQKITINEWLIRLERTRDFSRSQAKLARTVCHILKSVTENAQFRELFFVQAEANNTCCEDRAAMALNEIYTSWRILCLPADLKEKLKIMTGVAKTLALRSELSRRIPKQERESVEIYLYYESLFKEHLCTAIEGMAYGEIGTRNWLNPEELLKKVNETFLPHLLALPAFDQLAKQELHEVWEGLQKNAHEQLTERPRGGSFSEAVLLWNVKQGEVMHDLNRNWAKVCEKWYAVFMAR